MLNNPWVVAFLILFPFWFYLVVRLAATGAMRSILEELLRALRMLAQKEEEKNG